MSFRRMLPFLLLNVIVSAIVVLGILFWWEGRSDGVGTTAVQVVPTLPVTVPPVVATAEAIIQATDTPEPADQPLIHVVQAGDTLGNLSTFYDVSMDDIMTANGLANPNLIAVGQQLIIPIGGIATATPEPTATPTAEVLPSPIATEPVADDGEVVITIGEVIGINALAEEAVQIINSGSRQVGLLDWQLSDGAGQVYTFDQVTLFEDEGTVLVHTRAGQDDFNNLYWGLQAPIWEPGDVVTLRDAEGTVQATFIIP